MKTRNIPRCMFVGMAMIMLAGCATATPAGSVDTASDDAATAPMTGTTGVSDEAPDGVWVTHGSSLATSRDGGDTWQESSLPGASGPAAVAVLPAETIVVTGAGSRSVRVSTMPVGKSTWHTDTVSLPDVMGRAQIVQAGGRAAGILVTYQSSAQFSRGQWIEAVDGGASWLSHGTPAGGAAVHLLLGDTAAGTDALPWRLGPVLPVPGSFGPGALPAESAAAGVMWVLAGGASVVQVDLTSNTSRVVPASGLPSGMGSVDLHAESATSAWLRYTANVCSEAKSDCATSTGMLRTTDSGATWRPVPSPLGE